MSDSATPAPVLPPARRSYWGWWLLGGLAVVALLLGLALHFLDPWLKQKLEKQVAGQTHNQYQLQIGDLNTHLLSRTIELRYLRLRPAAQVADTLPRLRAAAARLTVSGIGLWAILRQNVVPVDSFALDSLRFVLEALPQKPGHPDPRPLHQRLPLGLPGLRLGHLRLHDAQLVAQNEAKPLARLRRADLSARDLLLTAAGAADTQRLAYAATWQVALRGTRFDGGLHQIRVGRAYFSTDSQSLTLHRVQLWPARPDEPRHGAARFRLNLPELRARGLKAAIWQHQHHFQADSLVLESPSLSFWPPGQPPPPVWKMLAPLLGRADVKAGQVRHGWLAFAELSHQPVARGINLLGLGIRVDSVAGRNGSGRVLYARRWVGSSGRITATFSAPEYPASIAQLNFDTQKGWVRLRRLALMPKYRPAELNRLKGYQKSTIALRIAEVNFQGVDFPQLADYKHIFLTRLTAERPRLYIASDGRGPLTPYLSDITPEAVRKLRLKIDVRRFDVHNGRLLSYYRSPFTPIAGTLRFTRFGGSIFNFSNTHHQTPATPLTGYAVGYLENQCRMEVHLRAYLLDPQGRHSGWGSFGPTSLAILNPMLLPTREMRFESGQVQGIAFTMQADQQRVTGTMRARYSDLKFQQLHYQEKEAKIDKTLWTRLKTGAVNAVVRDQNPRPGGRFVTGTMTSHREPRFSVFSLWRQGIVSGGLHSVGVPQKLAQKLSQSQDKAALPPPGAK